MIGWLVVIGRLIGCAQAPDKALVLQSLDTLMLDKGQTQRIAFAAEYDGRWLMESTGLSWAAPKLVRNYDVS